MKELYLKYKDYKAPHIKIQTEVKNNRLFLVTRGIYEDNPNVEGYLLSNYITQPAYLSFEYVLSKYGLITERVYTYTCATTLKEHNSLFKTKFGDFYYTDVPVNVFSYGVEVKIENGYSYMIASIEKALCDLVYKKKAVNSLDEFKELLFQDLRIDEEILFSLNKEEIEFLCPMYKKKNLNFLLQLMEGKNEQYYWSNVEEIWYIK